MLSLSYVLSTPGFNLKDIGHHALVRAYNADIEITFENDGQTTLRNITVQPVIESYIGQDQPKLFLTMEEITIETIPPKGIVAETFRIYPNFPGLISIAINITDTSGDIIPSKRKEEKTYDRQPVRWWFHVVDNVQIEILKTLKTLVQKQKKS